MEQEEVALSPVTPVGAWLGRALGAVEDGRVKPSKAVTDAMHEPVAARGLERPLPSGPALALVDRLLDVLHGSSEWSLARSDTPRSSPDATQEAPIAGVELRLYDDHVVRLVAGDKLVIGRAADADVHQVALPTVSRRHLRIECQADGVRATDLASTNGTSIIRAGIELPLAQSEPTPIQIGDRLVVLGQHVLAEVSAIST